MWHLSSGCHAAVAVLSGDVVPEIYCFVAAPTREELQIYVEEKKRKMNYEL